MILVIEETGKRRNLFRASVEGFGEIIASSRQPLLDGCRELVKRGVEPATPITMRYSKDSIDCLTSTVGEAARLMVSEAGGSAKFRVFGVDPMSATQNEE